MNEIKSLKIDGIECYEDEYGTAYLNLEAVAYGLGFIENRNRHNKTIRWRTVYKYLKTIDETIVSASFGAEDKQVQYKELCPKFIPESAFYQLAMKGSNDSAKAFQRKVATEILPGLRKKGGIVTDWATYLDSMSAEEANFVAELFKENAKKKKEIELLKLENARKKEPWKERRYKGELYSLREASKILGLPQNEFISWLSENNFIFKNQWDRWEAYRQYVEGDRPLLKYIHTMRNGSPRSQTKVTEYGIDYFEEELNI